MKLPIIDDNFLSLDEIMKIESWFYSVPAKFSPFTTHAPQNNLPKLTDTYSNRFMYCSYDGKENFTNKIALYVLDKFCKKHNIVYNEVSRTRSNTTFLCNEKRPSKPHVDSEESHLVLLYYVNNSDGDTVFYKNKYNEELDNEMIVDSVVSPKAGRAVLFDGSTYHSFHYPNTHDLRSVININIIGENKNA